jgi:curved DNA-binding protein CbpA
MTEPSMDLYAVLGLSRDADQAAIRRAYRNKARHAHPDGGGSPESFARVKTAYDTLINDARRQHYDETGEFDDAPINNAQVAEMLFAGLDLAMLNLSQYANPPKQVDWVLLIRNALRRRRREWMTLRRELEKAAERSHALVGRFRTASGDNLMETVVERRIATCQTEIGTLNVRIKVADQALEALTTVTFHADEEPRALADQQWGPLAELVRRFG